MSASTTLFEPIGDQHCFAENAVLMPITPTIRAAIVTAMLLTSTAADAQPPVPRAVGMTPTHGSDLLLAEAAQPMPRDFHDRVPRRCTHPLLAGSVAAVGTWLGVRMVVAFYRVTLGALVPVDVDLDWVPYAAVGVGAIAAVREARCTERQD